MKKNPLAHSKKKTTADAAAPPEDLPRENSGSAILSFLFFFRIYIPLHNFKIITHKKKLTEVRSSRAGRCKRQTRDRRRLDYDTEKTSKNIEPQLVPYVERDGRRAHRERAATMCCPSFFSESKKTADTNLTLLQAGEAVGVFRAGLVAMESLPATGTSAGSVDRIAFRSVETRTAISTVGAPLVLRTSCAPSEKQRRRKEIPYTLVLAH